MKLTMKSMSRVVCSIVFCVLIPGAALAEEFVLDTKGAHSFVRFKASHLGYSWLYGEFTKFDGEFTYDAKDDSKNSIAMQVDMSSVDSNHAERDKHLRTGDFLNVETFPSASFKSTSFKSTGEKTAKLEGELTFLGVTKPISLDVEVIGGGEDPWGGYRQGFEATTTLKTGDFNMAWAKNFAEVELIISVEGCKKPNSNCGG